MYNQSSYTTFLPILAKNWDIFLDHFNITFTCDPGPFSTEIGKRVCDVVQSVRSIVMNQPRSSSWARISISRIEQPHRRPPERPSDDHVHGDRALHLNSSRRRRPRSRT